MNTFLFSPAAALLMLTLLAAGWLPAAAQPRAAAGGAGVAARPASDSLVRHFLARALTMQGLKDPDFTPAERRTFAAWAGRAGTRFAGRVGGFWATPRTPAAEQALFDTLRRTVALLHRARPGMAVQGAVFEVIEPCASNLPVPNAVRAEFGEDTLAVPRRNFRFAAMMYPDYFGRAPGHPHRWDDRLPGLAPGVPDMSQPETQLWFYAFARRQLDAGCEAIHFGQVMMMDARDLGHAGWWQMLSRVRAYARTRNRGFVLCDAHTHGEYYDPDPARPLPDSLRQLLFDFHGCPLRPVENDTLRAGPHGARLEAASPYGRTAAIFGRSGGGRAPGGQFVRHLPALVEFDNWGACSRPGQPGQWPCVWGYDEISWFALQPPAYRDQWLLYATRRVAALDPDAYLALPGIRGVVALPLAPWLYRANRDGQAAVIPALWAGQTASWDESMHFVGPVRP